MTGFRPDAPPRPCRHCTHFLALDVAAGAALCGQPGRLYRHVQHRDGCVFWQREPGTDDDLGDTATKSPAGAEALAGLLVGL